jgi:hypothetical protein
MSRFEEELAALQGIRTSSGKRCNPVPHRAPEPSRGGLSPSLAYNLGIVPDSLTLTWSLLNITSSTNSADCKKQESNARNERLINCGVKTGPFACYDCSTLAAQHN